MPSVSFRSSARHSSHPHAAHSPTHQNQTSHLPTQNHYPPPFPPRRIQGQLPMYHRIDGPPAPRHALAPEEQITAEISGLELRMRNMYTGQ